MVRKEIDKMLRAEFITTINTAWSFPMVIETNKDGSARFLADYLALNVEMKPDRLLLPRIEQMFDDLRGTSLFTKIYLFLEW